MTERNEIKADISALRIESDVLKTHTEALRQKTVELKNSISALDNCWRGNAAEKFKLSFLDTLSLLDEYEQSMIKLSSEHEFALKEYESCLVQAEEIIAALDV